MPAHLLAISGSARRDSYNLKLARAMAEGASAAGATVTLIDWADFDLPLFNEDLEARGIPPAVRAFKAEMRRADGLLIASPENNGGYSAHIKNAIDWCSRTLPDDPPGSVFKNKPLAIAGATTGRLGAVRSIRQLREILGQLGCVLLPDTVSISDASKAFDAEGRISDEKPRAAAMAVGAAVARAVAKA